MNKTVKAGGTPNENNQLDIGIDEEIEDLTEVNLESIKQTISQRDILIGLLQNQINKVEECYRNSIKGVKLMKHKYNNTLDELLALKDLYKEVMEENKRLADQCKRCPSSSVLINHSDVNKWTKEYKAIMDKFDGMERHLAYMRELLATSDEDMIQQTVAIAEKEDVFLKEMKNVENLIFNQGNTLKDLIEKVSFTHDQCKKNREQLETQLAINSQLFHMTNSRTIQKNKSDQAELSDAKMDMEKEEKEVDDKNEIELIEMTSAEEDPIPEQSESKVKSMIKRFTQSYTTTQHPITEKSTTRSQITKHPTNSSKELHVLKAPTPDSKQRGDENLKETIETEVTEKEKEENKSYYVNKKEVILVSLNPDFTGKCPVNYSKQSDSEEFGLDPAMFLNLTKSQQSENKGIIASEEFLQLVIEIQQKQKDYEAKDKEINHLKRKLEHLNKMCEDRDNKVTETNKHISSLTKELEQIENIVELCRKHCSKQREKTKVLEKENRVLYRELELLRNGDNKTDQAQSGSQLRDSYMQAKRTMLQKTDSFIMRNKKKNLELIFKSRVRNFEKQIRNLQKELHDLKIDRNMQKMAVEKLNTDLENMTGARNKLQRDLCGERKTVQKYEKLLQESAQKLYHVLSFINQEKYNSKPKSPEVNFMKARMSNQDKMEEAIERIKEETGILIGEIAGLKVKNNNTLKEKLLLIKKMKEMKETLNSPVTPPDVSWEKEKENYEQEIQRLRSEALLAKKLKEEIDICLQENYSLKKKTEQLETENQQYVNQIKNLQAQQNVNDETKSELPEFILAREKSNNKEEEIAKDLARNLEEKLNASEAEDVKIIELPQSLPMTKNSDERTKITELLERQQRLILENNKKISDVLKSTAMKDSRLSFSSPDPSYTTTNNYPDNGEDLGNELEYTDSSDVSEEVAEQNHRSICMLENVKDELLKLHIAVSGGGGGKNSLVLQVQKDKVAGLEEEVQKLLSDLDKKHFRLLNNTNISIYELGSSIEYFIENLGKIQSVLEAQDNPDLHSINLCKSIQSKLKPVEIYAPYGRS